MTFARDTDPMLRRFERNQVLICVAATLLAALFGRLDVAAGVVGGTVLMAIGYGGIKSIVNVLTSRATGQNRPENARSRARRRVWATVKFASSYALLALTAYVMLIRLKLHPLGVFLGASTPVISIAIEGVALARRLPHAGQSK